MTTLDFQYSQKFMIGINVEEMDQMELVGISFINFGSSSQTEALIVVQEARENSTLTVSNCSFNSGPGTVFGEFVSIFSLQDAIHLRTLFEYTIFESNSCVIAKGTGVFQVHSCQFSNNNKTLFDLLGGHLFIDKTSFVGNHECK